MKDIIDWLLKVEKESGNIYNMAAELFTEDHKLYELLSELASDEEHHNDMITQAADIVSQIDNSKLKELYFSVDGQTMRKLEKPIEDFNLALKSGAEFCEESALELIIDIEFSELNDLFVYVLESLKANSNDFITAAACIQQHRRRIERFLEAETRHKDKLARLRPLPSLWTEKLLIVDDSVILKELFAAVLEAEGFIDCASNGKEALDKLDENFYAIIISDVEMPVMDGIDFYKAAVEKFPNIKKRFIFATGTDNNKNIDYFKENNLRYLIKPIPINELKTTVAEIMKRTLL